VRLDRDSRPALKNLCRKINRAVRNSFGAGEVSALTLALLMYTCLQCILEKTARTGPAKRSDVVITVCSRFIFAHVAGRPRQRMRSTVEDDKYRSILPDVAN